MNKFQSHASTVTKIGFVLSALTHLLFTLNWKWSCGSSPWLAMFLLCFSGIAFVLACSIVISVVLQSTYSNLGWKVDPWEPVKNAMSSRQKIGVTSLFLYTLINMLIFSFLYRGVPDKQNGQYILRQNSKAQRISHDEYQYQKAYQIRIATMFLMVFQYMIFCYFSISPDKLKKMPDDIKFKL